MKTSVLEISGAEKSKIDLPEVFSKEIREDIVFKVLETKKIKQPYSPSPVGGKQHSASGKMRHRRHVWQTHYGRGMSRIPRKVMSRRGSQFHWVGAEISSARGGRRAHPPKVLGIINTKRINKKELQIALESAISATASARWINKRYKRLTEEDVKKAPFIVDGKITSLKTKEALAVLKKILGNKVFELAIKVKTIRSGKGKSRGRRYKSNAGLIFVIGNKEKMKLKVIDHVKVKELGVKDLANGGLGRLAIYTEEAIKDLAGRTK
jgi:large subunit ribosomal protein L4e